MSLLLRALWWRRGLSLATLVVAAITIGAGSLGPLYAHAAAESTLRDALSRPGADAALHYTFQVELDTEADLANAESRGPQPGSIKAYPDTIPAVVLATQAATPAQVVAGDNGPHTQLVWRQDACAHLVAVRGRCPKAANEAMVSERTLQGNYYGWQIGGQLRLSGVRHDLPGAGSAAPVPSTVTIVGSYQPADSQDVYWQGRNYFDAHPGPGSGDQPDTVDDVFVDQAELETLAKPSLAQVQVDYPIAADRIRLADVATLKSEIGQLTAFRARTSRNDTFTTNVLAVLAAEHRERSLVNVATLLVSLQLAVLAWLVLFQVVADAVEAKGSEIALAKLRGLRPGATIRFGLAEPLLLVLLATPLGMLGGWLSVRLLASAVLVPGTPVVFTRGTVIAVLITLAGSAVAAAAAGRRTLRRPVLEQWRRTPGHHPSRWMLALDVLLAAGAVTGLVLLHGHAGSDPRAAALLAPALLVFAVALLGIRLLPLVLRPLLPATRGSARISLFLATRQVSRRPAGLRLAALLAVAVGLATFAIAGEGVAEKNRAARAEVEIGAPQVAPLQFQPVHDPVAATRVADPTGSWAMAVASWLPDGGGSVTGSVLAVDTSRLVAAAYSPYADLSTAQLARQLVPAGAAKPLTITASAVRVTLTADQLSPGNTPTVLLNLRRPGQFYLNARAGSLRPGSHTYTAPVPCQAGCVFAGITWDRPIDTFGALSGKVTVSRIETAAGGGWQPLAAGLGSAQNWRRATQASNASDRLTFSANGLTDTFSSQAGGSAGLARADSPRPLRTVAASNGVASGPDVPQPLQMVDVVGAAADYSVLATVRVLPVVQDAGMLVDLSAIRAQLPGFDGEANWSIWLGPKAPADAIARLRAAGLVLDPVRTERSRRAELARQGPALALALLVICAITGAILAVGGTAIAIASTGRRRSFELASLRALGIRRRVLLRAAIAEQLLLLGAAVLLGVPAGYFAARWTMPSIPEFADHTPVQLDYRPAPAGVLIFAAAFCALLMITAVIAGQLLLRAAAPARLREAE
ncbi:MAG: FtsX-like permease family protein [Jatrophihabitantaceae bacterium]